MCQLLLDEMVAYYSNTAVGKLHSSHPKGSHERRQLSLGKSLNRKDGGHNTPLMLACKNG